MSVEIHDSLIALLTEVATLKEKEGTLKAEKQRQLEAIAAAEGEVTRCNDELDQIRESQLKAKRSMDALRDELFKREDEEVIVMDETHVPTEGEGQKGDNAAKRAWNERAAHLKKVQ